MQTPAFLILVALLEQDLQMGCIDLGAVFDENAISRSGWRKLVVDEAEFPFGKCREVIEKDIGRIKAFAARELFTHSASAGHQVPAFI